MKQALLIESEFYARVRLDDELAVHGYQVTSVKRVKEALFKMKTQMFHILLTSYDKDPQMTLRLLATMRRSGNRTPAVVLAKKPTEEHLMQLLAFRPIEVLVKPYSLIELLDRIEHLHKATL